MDSLSDASFSFFAVSDLHIIGKAQGKSALKRQLAWRWLQSQPFAFGLFAGDITNGAQANEFAIARQETAAVAATLPLLFGYGNRDYIANSPGETASAESRNAFSAWWRSQAAKNGADVVSPAGAPYWSARVRGVQIVCLDCARDYPHSRAGEAQLCWLDEQLTQSDGERFRIVMSHFPLNDHVPGRMSRKQLCYVSDSKRQQDILNRHGRLLLFTGHTHNPLENVAPSVETDAERRIAYLNTASIGNTMPNSVMIKELRRQLWQTDVQAQRQIIQAQIDALNQSGSMGLCMDVTPNEIVVRGIDFLTGEYCAQCAFRIDL